jgi:hypothetical protein
MRGILVFTRKQLVQPNLRKGECRRHVQSRLAQACPANAHEQRRNSFTLLTQILYPGSNQIAAGEMSW